MTPIAFGGCFGWLHSAPGDRGVVICGGHGYEELVTHRIWRAQACRFAEAGLPTLRFDYHGTGDSIGADDDSGRVQAWLQSVREAVAYLRAHTGVEEVTLVGFRLGALLAAVAAETIDGIEGVALLAPPTTGAIYVRQMRVLARMAAPIENAPPVPPEWKDDVEMGGAFLTAETIAALGTMDLTKLTRAPARRVLLFNRPDLPPDTQLDARLAELGADVQVDTLKGYRDMVRFAPHLCLPPEEDMARLTQWVGMGASPRAGQPATNVSLARIELPDAVETPVRFGPNGMLFGIRCQPKGAARGMPILFLNTGANRHVGTCRLTVTLARRLAALGYPSWRIDLAGIGDSGTSPGQPDHVLDSIVSCADVYAALDMLEAAGHDRCTVIGLCSGAHLGFVCARQDSRIGRLVLINPQMFDLRDDSANGLRTWLWRNWRDMLHGKAKWPAVLPASVRRTCKALVTFASDRGARWASKRSGRNAVAKWFHRLGERGVRILLVYSPQDFGLSALEIYLGSQDGIEAAFPNVGLRVIAGTDHTLTKRWAREHLTRMLEAELVEPDRIVLSA